jgi:hypothetical protein
MTVSMLMPARRLKPIVLKKIAFPMTPSIAPIMILQKRTIPGLFTNSANEMSQTKNNPEIIPSASGFISSENSTANLAEKTVTIPPKITIEVININLEYFMLIDL